MTFLLGLLLLIGDIWAIVHVAGNRTESTFAKVLWILGILLFPLIGFLVWLFLGPRNTPVAAQA